MRSAGWTLRATGAVATGTTTLTVALPAGVVDNDILVLTLAHKGAGYAVVPAGWTLVQQGLSGATRGELYWKRAASEPATYAITGLATVARGVIVAYAGGVLTGSVVDVSRVDARAAATKLGTDSITTTVPYALLVGGVASGASESTFSWTLSQTPLDTSQGISLANRHQSSQTGLTVAVYDAIQQNPGPTLASAFTLTVTGEHVCLIAALIPDTSQIATGTRYYLSKRAPVSHPMGPVHGGWHASMAHTAGYHVKDFVWELSQAKTDCGAIATSAGISWNQNDPLPANLLFYRWKTPPLDAQTIDGTLNLAQIAFVFANGSGTPAPSCKFRLHVYVTVGQTNDVRAVLLDRFVDSASWNDVSTKAQTLAAPAVLTPQTCLAGDSVMVELGVELSVAGPFPTETRPPSHWVTARFAYGAQLNADTWVAALDAVPGSTSTTQATWLDFSHTFAERAYAGTVPANINGATAEVIPSIPFATTVDTTHCPSPRRNVWYKWTPTVSERVYIHCFGSRCAAAFALYTDISVSSTGIAPGQIDFKDQVWNGYSMNSRVYQVAAGTTYYIAVGTSAGGATSRAMSGGTIHFAITNKIPLADGDVLVASLGYLARYTKDGILAELRSTSYTISGLAIDYTRHPIGLYSINPDDPAQMAAIERLYYAVFGSDGVGVQDLNNPYRDYPGNLSGINYIFTAISPSAPASNPSRLVSALAINASGTLVIGYFGNGFLWVSYPSTSYLNVAATAGSGSLAITDTTHGNYWPLAPWPVAVIDTPAVDVGGTNYVEFDQTGEVVWYTSGGWYHPIGGQTIKRWNIVTHSQEPDFVTLPTGPGPNPGLKGLFPLPDTPTTPGGGCLVCNGAEVRYLDPTGATVRILAPADAVCLVDVELASDGRSVWFHDEASLVLYKYDLATGAQLLALDTGLGSHSTTSLVVYRASAYPTPSGVTYQECPCPDDPWPLSTMRDQIGARLHDPDHIRWTTTELNRIVWEALRTWNAFTGWASGRATVTLTPGVAFYQLNDLVPALRAPYVSDNELYAGINDKLLEGVATTPQFLQDFLTKSYGRRHQNVLVESGVVLVRRLETINVVSSDGRYPLDPCILAVRRTAWSENGDASTIPLYRDDQWGEDRYAHRFPQTPTRRPRVWSMSTRPPQYLQLVPIPTHTGTLDFICIIDCTPIPPDWTWVAPFGVLADLLGQSGPGQDLERARYAEARYRHGLEAMKTGSVVQSVRVENRLVPIHATPDLDQYKRRWQTVTGLPREAVTFGQTILGFSPVPDQAYSVTLDLTQIAPLPLNDTDLVFLPPAARDPVLDYCEHLALFKEGPGPLSESMILLERFFTAAGVRLSLDQALVPSRGSLWSQASHDQRSASPHHLKPEPALVSGVGSQPIFPNPEAP